MPHVAHFAINADDIPRARRFYEKVFGWKFNSWGPPNFYTIDTGEKPEPAYTRHGQGEISGIFGGLQGRRELLPGQKMIGYECSISVPSVDAVAASVVANGGKVVMPKVVIATVGSLIFFEDTEGNVAGAMQYDKNAK
jgi:predicted enzyme related to lactoylglutathione lyase